MEWAQLVLDYFRAVVWPALAVTAVVLLREPLRALLPRTSKAEFLGVSLEFTAQASAVAELASRLEAARPQVLVPDEPREILLPEPATAAPVPATVPAAEPTPEPPPAVAPSPQPASFWPSSPAPVPPPPAPYPSAQPYSRGPATVTGLGPLPGWTSGSYDGSAAAWNGSAHTDAGALVRAWSAVMASAYSVLRDAELADGGEPVVRAAGVLRDLGAFDAATADLAARTDALVRSVLTGGEPAAPTAVAALVAAAGVLSRAFDAAGRSLRTP